MEPTPNASQDGPGAEGAIHTIDGPEPHGPFPVIVVEGEVFCPNPQCGESLIDGGAVNWPHPTFANLEFEDGKIQVTDMMAGDPDPKSAECAACGQPLDTKGWSF